jgi:hypothetical protein
MGGRGRALGGGAGAQALRLAGWKWPGRHLPVNAQLLSTFPVDKFVDDSRYCNFYRVNQASIFRSMFFSSIFNIAFRT